MVVINFSMRQPHSDEVRQINYIDTYMQRNAWMYLSYTEIPIIYRNQVYLWLVSECYNREIYVTGRWLGKS